MKTQHAMSPFLLVAGAALLPLAIGCAEVGSEEPTDDATEDSEAYTSSPCKVSLTMSMDSIYVYAKMGFSGGGTECGFGVSVSGPGGFWVPNLGDHSAVTAGSGTRTVKAKRSDLCGSRKRQALPNGTYIVVASGSARAIPPAGASFGNTEVIRALNVVCK